MTVIYGHGEACEHQEETGLGKDQIRAEGLTKYAEAMELPIVTKM